MQSHPDPDVSAAGIIVHASCEVSLAVAAAGHRFNDLSRPVIVVIAPNHCQPECSMPTLTTLDFVVPGGKARVARATVRELVDRYPGEVLIDNLVHAREHAIVHLS